MFAALRAGDLMTYAVLALGLAAVVSGFLGWSAVRGKPRPPRSAMNAGTIALVLAILTSTLSVVGVMQSRLEADRAADQLPEDAQDAFRRQGYEATTGLSQLGASFGAFAFMLGMIAVIRVIIADKRRADDEGDEEWGLPIAQCVLGGIALFSVSAAAMPLAMGIPTAGKPAVDPVAQLEAAEGLLGEGRFAEGCGLLAQAFEGGARSDGQKADRIRGMVRECFEQRIEAALRMPPEARRAELEALRASKLPLSPAEKERLETELAAEAPP